MSFTSNGGVHVLGDIAVCSCLYDIVFVAEFATLLGHYDGLENQDEWVLCREYGTTRSKLLALSDMRADL